MINLKNKNKNLAVVVHVLQIWSFHVVVFHRMTKKCTKNCNTRAQLLFCSLILLFSDVAAAVAVVVLIRKLPNENAQPFHPWGLDVEPL